MMLPPFIVNSLFNATAAVENAPPSANGGLPDRSFSAAFKTDDPFVVWAWVSPQQCVFAIEQGLDFPLPGALCLSHYGAGAITWTISKYCLDLPTWLLRCDPITGVWTFPKNLGCLNVFQAASQTTFRISLSATASTTADDNTGITANGETSIDPRCDDPAPTGWSEGGGSLVICLGSMSEDGVHSAYSCNRGAEDDGSPQCATGGKASEADSFNERCPIGARSYNLED